MVWKNLKQRSLADSMLVDHVSVKELDSIHELIDWARLEHHLKDIHSSARGEKAWPTLMMFKEALNKVILAQEGIYKVFIVLDPRLLGDYESGFNQRLLKVLLLQSWYKLSDSALEKQLARDLLFRRFIALDISESVPDHSTFWLFRQNLDKLLLIDKLLQDINSQLIDQGLYIKSGGISIVDASVIEAPK